jgi:hypothetical protein
MNDMELREILEKYKKIAVIGLSPVPGRPSHGVTQYMMDHGYEIYGVRPGSPSTVLGRPNFEKIGDLPGGIEIIDIFRKPEAIPQVVDEIEKWMEKLPADQKPKVLWLQLGISHPEAERRARQLGLKVVSDKCIKIEHARLL